jgi:hypothetical protein
MDVSVHSNSTLDIRRQWIPYDRLLSLQKKQVMIEKAKNKEMDFRLMTLIYEREKQVRIHLVFSLIAYPLCSLFKHISTRAFKSAYLHMRVCTITIGHSM